MSGSDEYQMNASSFETYWNRIGIPVIAVLGGLIFAGSLVVGVIYTPMFPKDQFGALAQKIMYLHVPFAIVSFVAFFFGFCSAAWYLYSERNWYNDISHSFVEVGFLYSLGVLLSGPLWARPVWGVWWSEEPRLNTFLIMWCLYAVYFLIPPFLQDRNIRERFRGIMAVLGFLTVPLVYYSVDMIAAQKQNHPQRGLEMEPSMVWTLRGVMLGLFLLMICLSWTRYRVLRLERNRYLRIIGADDS